MEKSPEAIVKFLTEYNPNGIYKSGCYKCGQLALLMIPLLKAAGFSLIKKKVNKEKTHV